jgi:CheY-like chemotaxis protein
LVSAQPDANFPIDVLLVDAADIGNPSELKKCNMPALYADVPILVMGSSHDWGIVDEAGLFESVLFAPKPVRRPALLLAIKAAISRHAARVPSAHRPEKSERTVVRVLVAEDNKVNQIIARSFLEKLGCQVTVVKDGNEACIAVEQHEYDLVFMDCHMPGMDGFEATRLIRQTQNGRPRIPIIALTAAVLEEERAECYAAGMDDFLSKPVSQIALERTLHNWIPALRSYA